MKPLRYGYSGATVLALVLGGGAWNPQSVDGQSGAPVPRFVVDSGWPKPGPRSWVSDRLVTQEIGATCADPKNHHVIGLNRGNIQPIEKGMMLKAAPPVIEWDDAGNVVHAWGDRSTLPAGLHGCLIDHENNLWIGGNDDGVVQKWARDGSKMLMQIGTRASATAPMVNARALASTPVARSSTSRRTLR
jgi:hypothetical protein